MRLRLLRRRHLHAVATHVAAVTEIVAAPDVERDDTRLFLRCPRCKAITFSRMEGRGIWNVAGAVTSCPNGHRVTFGINDLFYLDGTPARREPV